MPAEKDKEKEEDVMTGISQAFCIAATLCVTVYGMAQAQELTEEEDTVTGWKRR